MQISEVAPAYGFAPAQRECFAYNRTGSTLTIGQVLQFDLKNTRQAETTDTVVGSSASVFANVVVPDAATAGRILAVAQEATEDNKLGRFVLAGVTKALVVNGSAAGDLGTPLVVVATTGTLDATTAANEVVYGIQLDQATADAAELVRVIFDGVGSFGTA